MEGTRADVNHNEVFISWTGADAGIKDAIVTYLQERGVSCTDSAMSCQGNFETWSRESAKACEIFLLLMTENARNSKYVPQEIRAAFEMDDADNRILIVCPDCGVYAGYPFAKDPELTLSAHRISAITYGNLVTGDILEEIYRKATALLINRLSEIYRKNTGPKYMKLLMEGVEFQGGTRDVNVPFEELYLKRMLTEREDDNGTVEVSAEDILNEYRVVFLYGAAGSGKSQYINQIREACSREDGKRRNPIAISLPCARCVSGKIEDFVREEIGHRCGRPEFSSDNLRRLLELAHVVLIFDGLDEIASVDKARGLLKNIEEFERIYGANAGVTYIVTSRNRQDADRIAVGDRGVRVLELERMTSEEARNLGHKIFLYFGSKYDEDGFFAELNDIQEEIRLNPLLFCQMAVIYKDRGKLPKTAVGIFDVITDITIRNAVGEVPDYYKKMVEQDIVRILHEYSFLRYKESAEAQGKSSVEGYFTRILEEEYPHDARERARFLIGYLSRRSVMVEGEFYHKMLLEYFTAVRFYEKIFENRDRDEARMHLKELIGHYSEDYWTGVIQLFL